ncbi:MAG: cell division protein ZapE [Proteobacteria bacterium]|nr:cell division protein ZapE [Pseudomonadota bacterium]
MRISGISNVREAYEASLRRDGHERDSAQDVIVAELEQLQVALQSAAAAKRSIVDRLLRRSSPPAVAVPGLYIWGGVGRGKTFLLDLFFETLAIPAKKRIHFHRMMHDVHARLARLPDIEDPVDRVAADIANETHVLCFDEFYVSDIADAMLLGRLLEGLFQRGVTLVATSNSAPDELYKDGLQRQRFVPAIESLKQHTRVIHMADGTDYRLRLLQEAGTYLTPNDAAAQRKLQHYFEETASSAIAMKGTIEVNGRKIRTQRSAKSIVWFDFKDICDGPRSQNDYIELARWYPTVILSAVPALDASRDNQARRFIALVDEFYDRRVKLIISAESAPDQLYQGRRLGFEFERTVSRLVEMQSTDYLAAPHRG